MLPALVPLLPAGPAGRRLQAPLKRVHESLARTSARSFPALTLAFAAYLAVQGLVKLA